MSKQSCTHYVTTLSSFARKTDYSYATGISESLLIKNQLCIMCMHEVSPGHHYESPLRSSFVEFKLFSACVIYVTSAGQPGYANVNNMLALGMSQT